MSATRKLLEKAAEEAHAVVRWSRTDEGAKGWDRMEGIIIRSWAESILSMKRRQLVLLSAYYFLWELPFTPFHFFFRANDRPIYTLINITAMCYLAFQVLHLSYGVPLLIVSFWALELFVAPGSQRSNTLMLTNILTAGRHLREFAEELKEFPTTHRHMSDAEFGVFLPKIKICAGGDMEKVFDGLFTLYWARKHMKRPEISSRLQDIIDRLMAANDRRYRQIAIEIDRRINELGQRPSYHDEKCLSDELLPKWEEAVSRRG